MNAYRDLYPVERMAHVLGVSRAGYYAWRKRTPSDRMRDRAIFDALVRHAFEQRRRRYGRARLTRELHHQGVACGQKRVARSMARQQLRVRRLRRFRRMADAPPMAAPAPNLLARVFTASAPNQVWVSDITQLPIRGGVVFLVIFLDLYSRRIVGWAVSDVQRHTLLLTAFDRAVRLRQPPRGLIVHSDQGTQYRAIAFQDHMTLHGVRQSMSRRGNCWDNAVAESFFATLKKDLADHTTSTFETVELAERVLFDYIELYYNRQRLHSTLAYRSPVTFEEQNAAVTA
jgi:transposase InsO family protein